MHIALFKKYHLYRSYKLSTSRVTSFNNGFKHQNMEICFLPGCLSSIAQSTLLPAISSLGFHEASIEASLGPRDSTSRWIPKKERMVLVFGKCILYQPITFSKTKTIVRFLYLLLSLKDFRANEHALY